MRYAIAATLVTGLLLPLGCASIYGVTDLPSDEGNDASSGHVDARADSRADAAHPKDSAPSDASKETSSSHDAGDGAHPPKDAEADTPSDAAPEASVLTFTVSTPATVLPGASASLTVTLTNPASADVMVSVSALPTGVTTTPITIPAGSTTGMLTLTAAASALTGVTTPLVQAGSASQSFTLVVPGASGSFDSTFNQSGAQDFTPTGGTAAATALSLAVQSDGSILVGGTLGGSAGWALARFLPDGTPDAAFNANVVDGTMGALLASGGTFGGIAVVPSTGLIVVSGYDTDGGQGNLAIFLLNSDGSRHESFGTAGLYTRGLDVNFHVATVSGPAVFTNGDIAVTGTTIVNAITGGYVITLTGPTNATFNEYQGFPAGVGPVAVGYQPSGEIVVGGASPAGGGQYYLARFSSGLAPETFAGAVGPAGTGAADLYLTPAAMALDPSGGVFLVGADDQLDPTPSMTFASATGTVPLTMGYANTGPYRMNGNGYVGVASGTTGTAVAVANGYDMAGSDVYVVRITSAGVLDTTFANMGVLETDNLTTSRVYDAVAIDAVGRIIVAGNASAGFYIMRVWP